MIYGLIPVGGKANRLNMSFCKELLPLKGYNYYRPVIDLTVQNMLYAECQKICFVHGRNYKNSIKKIYSNDCKFTHIRNFSSEQIRVILAFHNSIDYADDDEILYGLPDTFYNKNLFPNLLQEKGLVCGIYTVDNNSIVGRLDMHDEKFIKSAKNDLVMDKCWAVVKFTGKIFRDCISLYRGRKNKEMIFEDILNSYPKKLVFGDHMYDLGTWDSLNKYWNDKKLDMKNE